jgi:hypothetical protein
LESLDFIAGTGLLKDLPDSPSATDLLSGGVLAKEAGFSCEGSRKSIDRPARKIRRARIVRAKEGSVVLFVVEPTEGVFSRQVGKSDFGRKSGFTNREEPVLAGIWAKALKGKSVVALPSPFFLLLQTPREQSTAGAAKGLPKG